MKQFLMTLSLLLAFFGAIQAQEATAVLDRNEIKIGQQTTIELNLRFPAALQTVMMPALKDTISKFVEIVEISDVDTTFDEDDITTKIFTQKITITSWDSGFHAIPPFKFVVDNDTISTKALLLSVNTVSIQADQDIKDIKEIIEVPFSLWDWILTNRMIIGLVILILVLIVAGVILYRRYKNRPVEEKIQEVPKEAADLVARRKLEELNSKNLWQSDKTKAYYSELSFIVREYIENRYHLRALEQTTDEIITMISSSTEVSKELRDKLHQTLMLADMAKFAKQKPIASENEMAFSNASLFVEETAYKPEVEETEKPEDNA